MTRPPRGLGEIAAQMYLDGKTAVATELDSFVASLRNLQRGGVEAVEIGPLIDDLARIAESAPTLPTLADVRRRSDDEISRASDELSTP